MGQLSVRGEGTGYWGRSPQHDSVKIIFLSMSLVSSSTQEKMLVGEGEGTPDLTFVKVAEREYGMLQSLVLNQGQKVALVLVGVHPAQQLYLMWAVFAQSPNTTIMT